MAVEVISCKASAVQGSVRRSHARADTRYSVTPVTKPEMCIVLARATCIVAAAWVGRPTHAMDSYASPIHVRHAMPSDGTAPDKV